MNNVTHSIGWIKEKESHDYFNRWRKNISEHLQYTNDFVKVQNRKKKKKRERERQSYLNMI